MSRAGFPQRSVSLGHSERPAKPWAFPSRRVPHSHPCTFRNSAMYLFCMTDLASAFLQVLPVLYVTEPMYQVNLMIFFILANCSLLPALSAVLIPQHWLQWKRKIKKLVCKYKSSGFISTTAWSLTPQGQGLLRQRLMGGRGPQEGAGEGCILGSAGSPPSQAALKPYTLFSLQID